MRNYISFYFEITNQYFDEVSQYIEILSNYFEKGFIQKCSHCCEK